ncbi:hypothetical protein A4H97_27415 [Niastella yeongjuensis]|uniref:Secretion system C-terminal sorting domain-containing protein n=1 Tax=Niastella yeongjuensis TaxID=354355 RepID=A0A1V9EYQ3_9BACT|nr:T9SS type A sorting domain-containing protein [Niastella yeongjuensis]OQP51311.1 hypothetical protein A4H97_27415 [Niastella yeongjuensis]
MKLDSRTRANTRWLLVILWVVLSTRAINAQCPAGSTPNTPGTYALGTTVCITTAVSGNITLNSGATMIVISGGNYTGNLDAKKGSAIIIQNGGIFAPGNANNFAATLTNNGTVNGNISVDDGAAITNNGSFTWGASWNQNKTITVTNTACGRMSFSQNTNVKANAQIINNGVLNFAQGLTSDNGTTINNRGRITFSGDLNIGGTFINQNKAIIKGNNNTISSNKVGDSLINTGTITVSNTSIKTSTRTRNEGLLVVEGSYTINGESFKINNSNAYVRVGGSFSNNGQVQGNGSLYVGGAIGNNQTISGNGPAAPLTVNKNSGEINGTTFAINYNNALVSKDTTNYTPTMANPDACVVLDLVVVPTRNIVATPTGVFPNPFKDILQISMQLEKAGVIQVALYNSSGQLVSKVQQQGLLGRNTIVMYNLSALLPGIYLVQIKTDKHTSFEKLIK